MGNTTSVIKLSDSISPPLEEIEDARIKPIQDCTNRDLYCLCLHFEFYDPEVHNILLTNREFDGKLFKTLTHGTDDGSLAEERKRIYNDKLHSYMSKGDATQFLEDVIMAKIREDRRDGRIKDTNRSVTIGSSADTSLSLSQDWPNCSGQSSINSGNSNRTFALINQSRFSSPSVGPMIVDANVCKTDVKFNDNYLTAVEKTKIAVVKKKIEKYYDFLKKNNREPKDARMTGIIEVDAQNLVCEDRLLNREFLSSIVTKNSKKVNAEAFLRVKLLISDLGNSPFMTRLMSFFSGADLGVVHTGLLIGEWKIEWVNSSLVIIRSDSVQQIKAEKTLAAIDIGDIKGAENVKNTFKKLASIISKYNGTIQYDRSNANCQNFVLEILRELNLDLPRSECFDKYFENLKKGQVERTFYFSATLRHLINNSRSSNIYLSKTFLTFKDRRSLNIFCNFIDSLGYFTTFEGGQDFWLLKAFDRSFSVIGDTAVEVIEENGSMRDNCFFTLNGAKDNNTINKIRYSVVGIDFNDFELRKTD